jgi:gliding motility-associated-like protein
MLWDRELSMDEIASYCNIGQTYSANVEVACPGETTTLEIVGITDPGSIVSVNWEIDGVGGFTGTVLELDNLVSGFYTYSAVVETSDGQIQNFQGSFTIPGLPDVSDINLPDQLSLCGVDQVSISFGDVLADWDQVLNPDGIAIQDFTFTSPGVYAFTFVHVCGEEIFEVDVSADFVLSNLGLPTDACVGDPITAELTFPIGSEADVVVDWGDGTTENVDGDIGLSHVYNSTGTFVIQITGDVDGCALDAQQTIDVGIPPEFELELTSTLCDGETYSIEFFPQGFDVLGPNGNEITSFEATLSGSYTFSAQNVCGTVTQTVELTFLEINPQQIIYNPNICPERDTLVIGFTDPAFTYIWTNMSTSSSITVSTPGNYQVQVSIDGCSETFNFGVAEVEPLDLSQFPDDEVVVCSEGDRMLILPNLGVPYTFSDGSQGRTYLVEGSETLELSFTDGCYVYNKALDIELIDCLCPLFVPNAFTPDEDGLNDIFKPVADCPVEDYHLRIFNRLGTLIFESRNINFGWNGRSPNENYYAENELYLYHIVYAQRLDGLLNPKELSGHLTLLR